MSELNKSEIDKHFGNIFKNYRNKQGLTQETIAELLNISSKYISRIENGTSGVSDETLISYINILGIVPNDLYADFITNENLKVQIELSKKISNLPDNKLKFLLNILENLEKL